MRGASADRRARLGAPDGLADGAGVERNRGLTARGPHRADASTHAVGSARSRGDRGPRDGAREGERQAARGGSAMGQSRGWPTSPAPTSCAPGTTPGEGSCGQLEGAPAATSTRSTRRRRRSQGWRGGQPKGTGLIATELPERGLTPAQGPRGCSPRLEPTAATSGSAPAATSCSRSPERSRRTPGCGVPAKRGERLPRPEDIRGWRVDRGPGEPGPVTDDVSEPQTGTWAIDQRPT